MKEFEKSKSYIGVTRKVDKNSRLIIPQEFVSLLLDPNDPTVDIKLSYQGGEYVIEIRQAMDPTKEKKERLYHETNITK